MTGFVALCGLIFAAALLAGVASTAASVLRSRRVMGRLVGSVPDDRPAGPTSGAVACEVVTEVVLPGCVVSDVPVILRYDPHDPYAVVAEFHLASGPGVPWVFARELVSRGLREPAGGGDVRIRPCEFRGAPGASIALHSPDGEALVRASAGDIEAFLRRTYLVCPPGAEGRHLDLDKDLDGLLTR